MSKTFKDFLSESQKKELSKKIAGLPSFSYKGKELQLLVDLEMGAALGPFGPKFYFWSICIDLHTGALTLYKWDLSEKAETLFDRIEKLNDRSFELFEEDEKSQEELKIIADEKDDLYFELQNLELDLVDLNSPIEASALDTDLPTYLDSKTIWPEEYWDWYDNLEK